jgi:hypothetical protein
MADKTKRAEGANQIARRASAGCGVEENQTEVGPVSPPVAQGSSGKPTGQAALSWTTAKWALLGVLAAKLPAARDCGDSPAGSWLQSESDLRARVRCTERAL